MVSNYLRHRHFVLKSVDYDIDARIVVSKNKEKLRQLALGHLEI